MNIAQSEFYISFVPLTDMFDADVAVGLDPDLTGIAESFPAHRSLVSFSEVFFSLNILWDEQRALVGVVAHKRIDAIDLTTIQLATW